MTLLQKIEKKRNIKIKKERNKKIAIATAGITTGAIAGTVAGVLIAPKSGKETIQDVKGKINKNINTTKNKVEESKCKIKDYLDRKRKSKVKFVEVNPLKTIENTKIEETIDA